MKPMPPSPALDTCIMYLVRHGATLNNVADPPKLQGRRTDLGLSPEGLRQAELTAQLLADRPLAAVFSSPLRRARETAERIAAPHGLDVTPVEELTEVDVGDWEEMSWERIEQDYPDEHHRFMTDPATHGYLGGEDLSQVLDRVAPAMERLLAGSLGREIVVVGHNVVNRVYLASLLALPIAKARGIYQDNCGVNVIRHRRGRTKTLTTNAAFHLSPPKAPAHRIGSAGE